MPRNPNEQPGALKRWIRAGAVALVAGLLLRTFVLQGVLVRSDSMYPTLVGGDILLVNRAATGAQLPFLHVRVPGYSTLRRCDIVLFDIPGGGDQTFAKRIVGVPGDTPLMREKILYINGERVDEQYVEPTVSRDVSDPKMSWQHPYLTATGASRIYAPTRDNWGPLVVPADRYFVLGDKRDGSLDSRYWGFVATRQIKGRAAFVYFSYQSTPEDERRIRWERVGKTLQC